MKPTALPATFNPNFSCLFDLRIFDLSLDWVAVVLAQSHLSLFGTGSDTNLRFKNVFYLTYFDFSLVSIDEFNFLKKSCLKKVEIVEI